MSLDQFICFTTDIVGLERTLRLVQSTLLILISHPLLLNLALTLFAHASTHNGGGKAVLDRAAALHILGGVAGQVNVARRFFRFFRFLECFRNAFRLFEALVSGQAAAPAKNQPRPMALEQWLSMFFPALIGMHLFLETLVLLDVMRVDGLAVWDPVVARQITVESQRFWFLGLGTNVAANLLRISRLTKDVPMPPLAEEEADQADQGEKQAEIPGEPSVEADKGSDSEKSEKALETLHKERLRLRRIVHGRMQQRRAWRRALRARLSLLGRRSLSDALDMIVPGNTIGWFPAKPSTTSLAMFVTTLLTGWEAWKRCGAEVAARKSHS